MSNQENQTSTAEGQSELAAVVMREEVEKCIHGCRFYGSSMDGMECGHPYWDDKEAYENMIISHDVDIPDECPLRNSQVKIIVGLKSDA